MSRGGKRPGAGRPKGSKNRRMRLVPAAAAAQPSVTIDSESPLEFLLRLMRDNEADERTRLEAAKVAAAYVHPKADQGKKARAEEAAQNAGFGSEWGDDLLPFPAGNSAVTKQ